MPSEAYQNLDSRLKDLEQLMQAHTALTQFRRARIATEQAGGNLAKISTVVDRLVTLPGRGRRAEVGALNRAGIVLLSAHLQGYIEDVYEEAARRLLRNAVKSVEALVYEARGRFSNPHADVIERLFSSIGLPKILDNVSWQRASNQSIRRRLTGYVQIRNRIAHGSQEPVSKAKVGEFRKFVEVFAEKFDTKVHDEIERVMGTAPW